MATIPVERTWVAGEVVTAAYFNSNLRDAINFLLSMPVAELRQSVAQSLTNGTPAPITMDVEDTDNDGGHDLVSNTYRYTAQTALRFQFSGGIGYAASATGRRGAQWFKNGIAQAAGSAMIPATAANDMVVVPRTMTFFLNINDHIDLWGYQESGGALNTFVAGTNNQGQSSMSVRGVGTA